MTTRNLSQLLTGVADVSALDDELYIDGLTLDSRQVHANDVFVALQGTRQHGIAFVQSAIERGAVAVLAEGPPQAILLPVPVIWIENLRAALGELAERCYHPTRAYPVVIGVTGTNGKTSTVQLLAQALERLGYRAATIGTLGAGLHGALQAGERTTPDVLSVHRLLAEFRAAGATHVVMEVSSHALEQGRVDAVPFSVAVFTNLTRDHLDYHGSMDAYGAAKAKLFHWPWLDAAVINIDDAFGRELVDSLPADVQCFRVSATGSADADLGAGDIICTAHGLDFDLLWETESVPLSSPLLGRFNVANLLTVAACLLALGEEPEQIYGVLGQLEPIPGRMNRLGGKHGQPLLVVDYAHTPDALAQALSALRAHCAGRLICVFGCGGDRDAGKRPEVGAMVEKLADLAIVSDDNPRSESGDAIVADILAGVQRPAAMRVIRDRAAAIRQALELARADDVVLIAGKGHETYQEDASGKRPFDDLTVARRMLEGRV